LADLADVFDTTTDHVIIVAETATGGNTTYQVFFGVTPKTALGGVYESRFLGSSGSTVSWISRMRAVYATVSGSSSGRAARALDTDTLTVNEAVVDTTRTTAQAQSSMGGLTTGVVVGIVIGCIAAVAAIVAGILVYRTRQSADATSGSVGGSHTQSAVPDAKDFDGVAFKDSNAATAAGPSVGPQHQYAYNVREVVQGPAFGQRAVNPLPPTSVGSTGRPAAVAFTPGSYY
jgi:hypothetical protein